MASTLSPASSPRLPSPPPMAEDQLGPKSPIAAPDERGKIAHSLDRGAARRIRPGTKAADMAEGPPLVDLTEIDSAFQLTEHLKALHNFLTHPLGAQTEIAVDREIAHKLAQPPENVDRALWLYELCRFLTQRVNSIITALFSDNPPCSSQTCPEMRASEWQYLCAVHDPPKSCCAIDYCCHTLDWAANTLTSPKHFPSRLALGTEANTAHQQVRQLTNIFRRVYRIFAHAWFQHREMFWKMETRTGLYVFFKTVCDIYNLIPEDNYTIPSEAEGAASDEATSITAPMILKRDESLGEENEGVESTADHIVSAANTTKRHRATPSVGATSVATVMEENEEEEPQSDSENSEAHGPEQDTKHESVEAANAEAKGEAARVPSPTTEPRLESSEAEEEAKTEEASSEPADGPTDQRQQDPSEEAQTTSESAAEESPGQAQESEQRAEAQGTREEGAEKGEGEEGVGES